MFPLSLLYWSGAVPIFPKPYRQEADTWPKAPGNQVDNRTLFIVPCKPQFSLAWCPSAFP